MGTDYSSGKGFLGAINKKFTKAQWIFGDWPNFHLYKETSGMSYSLNYSNLFTQTQKHKRQNYFKASRGTKKILPNCPHY